MSGDELPGAPSPEIRQAADVWRTLVGPRLQVAFDRYADRALRGLAANSFALRTAARFAEGDPAQIPAPALVVSDSDWLAALDGVGLSVAVEDGYSAIIAAAAEEAPVVLVAPSPERAVREHLAEIRSWAPGFTRDVVDVVTAGVRDGLSSDEISANLTRHVRGVNGKRGDNIARTEANAAQNAGRTVVADATGLGYERVWSATPDARVRFDHAAANGQVRGVGQPFTVGGSLCQYPGDVSLPPEQRARCRCTVNLAYGGFDPGQVRDAANAWRRRVAEIARDDGMDLAPDLAALVGATR